MSPPDSDMNHQHKLIAIFMVVSLACGGATALTKDDYKSLNDRISADYKIAKKNCGELKSNAKDICVSEAKGAEKVANAELEAQFKPSEKAMYKVNRVSGEATAATNQKVSDAVNEANYKAAKERCETFAGDVKSRCVTDIKAKFGKT